MKTTVQIICMTCPERLSATDECGGEEASKAVEAVAKLAGWVRVERRPKHPADVCGECASIIAEKWRAVLDEEFQEMRAQATRWLSKDQEPLSPETVEALLGDGPTPSNGDAKGVKR